MTGLLLASAAGLGVLLLHLGLTDRPPTAAPTGHRLLRRDQLVDGLRVVEARAATALARAGLEQVGPARFGLAVAAAAGLGVALATVLFGAGPAAVLAGAAAGAVPVGLWRRRRAATVRVARAAWPRLIEEVRVLTGAAGRPVPQALLDVGTRGPVELRPAFRAAEREWALTTDFPRTVAVLKDRLADPTADATCETLLVAHEVGGDVDALLARLAEDRRRDLRDRREAEAKQAGARVARWFVVLVPAGMALAGLNVGDGRASYRTTWGQVLVAAGVAMVAACWWWAGRIMRLPEPERVFGR